MISIPASEVLTGINFIAGVVSQVKENKSEIRRISARLKYLLDTIEGSRKSPTKQNEGGVAEEYDRAMMILLSLVKRAERMTRMELQRSLGDRTWNRAEITTELRRLKEDVDGYLGAHTVKALDEIQMSNTEKFEVLTTGMRDIMVKLAALEMKMQTPLGEKWPKTITVDAGNLLEANRAEAETTLPMLGTESSDIPPTRPLLQGSLRLASTHATVNVHITGLRLRGVMRFRKKAEPVVILNGLRSDAGLFEVAQGIRAQGHEAPLVLTEVEGFTVTVSDNDVFDASTPGGLQISSSTPLIHYYTKYNAYHNIARSYTPSHTIASAQGGNSVIVGGVEFRFHRTLRVPEGRCTQLPPSLGQFPIIPVGKFGSRVPESMRKRGGFIMPMVEREAMWMSFHNGSCQPASAVKVSVGGVNAITGVANDSHTPPTNIQDYIVVGVQPWLDGIATETGVVRQFVAMSHGNNYTVEEQITGQANTGGIQFDVFPLRDSAFVVKAKGTEVHLARHMTPAELHLKKGDSLIISRYSGNGGFSHVLGQGSSWSLARFQPDLNGTIWLKATYSSEAYAVAPRAPHSLNDGLLEEALGLAAGGHITQRIYADTQSPRMYDEEKGHRFHVYIIAPEAWEIITGVLPPISPVSEETYKMHNIPWYQLADDHLPVLPLPASNPLSGVKSVAQLDAASKHAEIDPNKPPGCTVHSSVASTCVFRPCSHTACSACLGTAMIARMSCPVPTCNARIARVVGMKDAVTIPAAGELEDQEGEMAWAVGKLEDLAIQAVDLGEVSIIHLEEDRVPGLHAPELA